MNSERQNFSKMAILAVKIMVTMANIMATNLNFEIFLEAKFSITLGKLESFNYG